MEGYDGGDDENYNDVDDNDVYINEMIQKTSGHVMNKEVKNTIRHVIGPLEFLITTVRKRKLRWNWHITRSTGLAQMILQGMVQGGRRKGRQKKEMER